MKSETKLCKQCANGFQPKRKGHKYCSTKCRNTFWNNQKRHLKKFRETIDYARLTFILSFIGFVGSIGFYFGVLREVYSPERDKHKIEVLTEQNAELQEAVNFLIDEQKTND